MKARKVVDFITELDGVITGYHSGSIKANFAGTPYDGHNRIPVPKGSKIRVGDRITFYDKNWVRKPNITLIKEGLLSVPAGYLLEGDELREMTQIERITAGIEELPLGFKIENGGLIEMTPVEIIESGLGELEPGFKIEDGQIIEMALEEKLANNLITQDEYDGQIRERNIAELNERLAIYYTPEALSDAEFDPSYAAIRAEAVQALRAVREQPGWPLAAGCGVAMKNQV